jgi:hypothetical protein
MRSELGWILLLPVAGGLYLFPTPAPAQNWWLDVGPAFRGSMEVKVSGSSYAEALGLNTDTGIGIGPAGAYADRTYDNGYVKVDPGTGKAGSLGASGTWNWGYNANSTLGQFNAGAGTLSFNRQGIPRYSALADGGSGLPLSTSDPWSVDWVIGFQGFWGAEAKFREDASLVDVTDTYNVAGITPTTAFTDLNHRGTYGGPFDATATPPYTVIPNLPASRMVSASASTAAVPSSVDLQVNQDLYQFNLGPQIGLRLAKRLQLVASPTISLNILDLDARRSETFAYGGTVQQWSDRGGATEVYVGFGLTAGANLDLGRDWFTGIFGGYDWVVERVDFTVGPNRITADASGWVAGWVVGKRF